MNYKIIMFLLLVTTSCSNLTEGDTMKKKEYDGKEVKLIAIAYKEFEKEKKNIDHYQVEIIENDDTVEFIFFPRYDGMVLIKKDNGIVEFKDYIGIPEGEVEVHYIIDKKNYKVIKTYYGR